MVSLTNLSTVLLKRNIRSIKWHGKLYRDWCECHLVSETSTKTSGCWWWVTSPFFIHNTSELWWVIYLIVSIVAKIFSSLAVIVHFQPLNSSLAHTTNQYLYYLTVKKKTLWVWNKSWLSHKISRLISIYPEAQQSRFINHTFVTCRVASYWIFFEHTQLVYFALCE